MYEARQNKEKVSRRISPTIQKSVQQFVLKHRRTTIQKYELGTGQTRFTTIKGNGKTCTFEECMYNYVEYNKGDKKHDGSGTQCPAAWADWIRNKNSTGNNASQLHVVNRRWGGLGGIDDHNIVPGTPAENSYHLHQAEVNFDNYCFGGLNGKTALHDCKYECWATPSYPKEINVTNSDYLYDDPTIFARITKFESNKSKDYPIYTPKQSLFICDSSLPRK